MEPEPVKSPLFYKQWWSIITRQWVGRVSSEEFALIAIIFDRTVGWGKEWEMISVGQLAEGVYSRDRLICYNTGLGASRRSVQRLLNTLIARGLIRVAKGNYSRHESNLYAINFDWKPDMLREPKKTKERPTALREPRSNRGDKSVTGPPVKNVTPPPDKSVTLRVGEYEEVEMKEESRKAGSGSSIIKGIAERHKEKKVQLLAKLLTERGLKQNDLHKLWDIAMKETYPETPYFAWKEKDGVILKSYANRYEKAVSDVSFGKYLDWVICYWRVVIQQSFHWMTDPPNFPAIGFLVRFSAKFEDTFARRAELEKLLALPTRERMIMTLTRKGMPVELAEAEVDQQLAVSRQLQEIKAIQSKLDSDRYKIAREWTRPLQPAFMKR